MGCSYLSLCGLKAAISLARETLHFTIHHQQKDKTIIHVFWGVFCKLCIRQKSFFSEDKYGAHELDNEEFSYHQVPRQI